MWLRGIRGATVSDDNSKAAILTATQNLLKELFTRNEIEIPQIASIFFSVTQDLDADFPAVAARHIGLEYTPMLCFREIPVPGGLPFCIRILVHYNTDKPQKDMVPVYLKAAKTLRPDITTSGL